MVNDVGSIRSNSGSFSYNDLRTNLHNKKWVNWEVFISVYNFCWSFFFISTYICFISSIQVALECIMRKWTNWAKTGNLLVLFVCFVVIKLSKWDCFDNQVWWERGSRKIWKLSVGGGIRSLPFKSLVCNLCSYSCMLEVLSSNSLIATAILSPRKIASIAWKFFITLVCGGS